MRCGINAGAGAIPPTPHLEPRRRAQLVEQHGHSDRVRRGQDGPEGHAQVERPAVREDVHGHEGREAGPPQDHGKRERHQLPEALEEEADVDVVRVQVQQAREEDEEEDLPLDPDPRGRRPGQGVGPELVVEGDPDERPDEEHDGSVWNGVRVAREDVVDGHAHHLREPREEEGVGLRLLLLQDLVDVVRDRLVAEVASLPLRRMPLRVSLPVGDGRDVGAEIHDSRGVGVVRAEQAHDGYVGDRAGEEAPALGDVDLVAAANHDLVARMWKSEETVFWF